MPDIAAIIVAAGRGTRAGDGLPKQYRSLGGSCAVRLSLEAFARHPLIEAVQPVIHSDDADRFAHAVTGLNHLPVAFGGATRQASVMAGLTALEKHQPAIVLVHDAARPLVSAALITRAVNAAEQFGSSIPVTRVTDTVKEVDANGVVLETHDRSALRLVQTPQAFRYRALCEAHRKASSVNRDDFTDDAALMEWAGEPVTVFEGDADNIKLTGADDFMRAEQLRMGNLGDVRIGNGVDVHAFGPGDHVTLGGIRIPHPKGLSGHSDADVVLHALVDAILGALADGDIGVHFPPSDPQWRGAASGRFVAFAMQRLSARGGLIAHADINIVCESPRIGPHRDAMRAHIASLLNVDPSRVAIKATTSEGLGFTGRGEGIAAFAAVTVRLPWGWP